MIYDVKISVTIDVAEGRDQYGALVNIRDDQDGVIGYNTEDDSVFIEVNGVILVVKTADLEAIMRIVFAING